MVSDTLSEDSIESLLKSEFTNSESQSGVFTEPKVIVQALIKFFLSSSLKHFVKLANAAFDTQYAPIEGKHYLQHDY